MQKTALITGSTSGIGLGIAQRFAQNSYNLVINGFAEKEKIDEIIQNLKKNGAKEVLYVNSDLSKPEEINDMFIQISKFCRGIDILVNNAGIQFVSPIEEFPEDKWEQIIRLNLISAFYTIKNSVPYMKKQKWGRIINIASAHALVASPFKSAYVAAKHGINGLTKSVALELAECGVTVNAICPGYVKTPLVDNQIKNTAIARNMSEEDVIRNVILNAQATKQFVTIEEISALAEYLSKNEAASITGAAIAIDGGWTVS